MKREEVNTVVYLRDGEVVLRRKLTSYFQLRELYVIYNDEKINLYRLDSHAIPRLVSTCSADELAGGVDNELSFSAFPDPAVTFLSFIKKVTQDKRIQQFLLDAPVGERIVASSWQEYGDDFNKVPFLITTATFFRN